MAKDFLTIDEFKALAARITAKQKYLEREFEKILFKDSCDSANCTLKFRDNLCDFYESLKRPADFYFSEADFKENTQTLQTTQLNLFGEEFC